jgi:hypothetical protein
MASGGQGRRPCTLLCRVLCCRRQILVGTWAVSTNLPQGLQASICWHMISLMALARLKTLACAMLVAAMPTIAQTSDVGREVEIRKSYTASSKDSDGSSAGSSSGSDGLLERVAAIRDGGRELIYDLPKSATKEDRARYWQFPVRVFQPYRGPTILLNQTDLEERLAKWLRSAGWDRSVCGRWVFTWTAIRIECDPQSVLETINSFDLRIDELRDGARYADSAAIEPGLLVRKTTDQDEVTFGVELSVNPEVIRRERAEADVVVGEITRQPVSLEQALRSRQKETISGTVIVTLEANKAGQIRRRVRTILLKTTKADNSTETETRTEAVERIEP